MMSYISKKSVSDSGAPKKIADMTAAPAFSDQRASTAVQLKQQGMMHSAHSPNSIQRLSTQEGEPLQREFESEAPVQQQEATAKTPNNTGLPDNLKSGIENLSGYSMDDVKVHFNSDKPAQLNAHAYAQGTDIHVAPGQEQHLPHEAWHVVQQKQGRVQPTLQMKAGVPVNDDAGLEHEADVMGAKALNPQPNRDLTVSGKPTTSAFQLETKIKYTPGYYTYNQKSHVVGSKMVAELDPNDEVNGSEPGSGVQKTLMEDLKNVGTFKSMIRGHLLNDNVGGLGVAMNLFPITSQANSRHKNYVESYVKQAIKDEGKGKKRKLIYSVDVDPAPESVDSVTPTASFVCDVRWDDGTKVVSNVIASNPQAGTTGTGVVKDSKAVSKTFRTKDLPKGWGKIGAGYVNGNSDHDNTRKRTQVEGIDKIKLTGDEYGHFGKGEPEIDVVAEQARTIIEDTFDDTSEDYMMYMADIDQHEADDNLQGLMKYFGA
ncbi:DUF4157 domain-containing protein [Cellvibrio sp. PSBB023]|uniref:eCIS core domain-containing protein n=1 Tax=Cellvibrio sp. PSBB023 TaxID=1945512 RepID=UPI001FEEEE6F|nr:DUF4157 domain-containing protein [Cellvibrio sp. PSBB023]